MHTSLKNKTTLVTGVSYALDLFGDRWTLLVIRDLFQGKQRFDEFISSPEGIATNILTHRLKRLTEHGLVKRIADEQDQRRFLYRLTPLGKSTQQFLRPMIRWSSAHSRRLAKPQTTED